MDESKYTLGARVTWAEYRGIDWTVRKSYDFTGIVAGFVPGAVVVQIDKKFIEPDENMVRWFYDRSHIVIKYEDIKGWE